MSRDEGPAAGESTRHGASESSDVAVPPAQDAVPARSPAGVTADPWLQLRRLTPARLALGRAGSSLPTSEVLRFGLAHAQARDAVHHALDAEGLVQRLQSAGYAVQTACSAASDRWQYLARPDLGRRLDDASRERLSAWHVESPDLLIVIGDGLSAVAVERHALPVLDAVCARLADSLVECPPVVVAREARVALGDDIGERLDAGIVAVLIGERPGLSSPDSMGIYVTHVPRVGRTDAERNCISNVRPAGLPYAAAAAELAALVRRIRQHHCSGIGLPTGELLGTYGESQK